MRQSVIIIYTSNHREADIAKIAPPMRNDLADRMVDALKSVGVNAESFPVTPLPFTLKD